MTTYSSPSRILLLAAASLFSVTAPAQTAAPAPTPAPTAVPAPRQPAGQQPVQADSQAKTAAPASTDAVTPAAPASSGVTIDRVVAVVNDDLILESDVDEERRFAAFEPYGDRPDFSREQAVNRLIDRSLILQQARLQPEDNVTSAQVTAQLQSLRKDIPACKTFHCETDAGWAKFVAAQGFTIPEIENRYQQKMQTLEFIEMRFRMGIRIEPAEIKTYYDDTFVPGYRKQSATPPPLADVSDRIQEVLLEQRVTSLLDDWLKTLRAQGQVRVIRPGEVIS
jgi:hypothetical protein